jgi:vacuolar-type H+-ATPase subunit H
MISWESQLAGLLERLSAAQRELLSLLATKRDLLVRRDHEGLAALASREGQLSDELRQCHSERERLLAAADAEGLPHDSLADLTAALSGRSAGALGESVDEARQRARLIRHECLTQWVAVQRTVLHLAQMLEIIATGGRSQPTYGNSRSVARGGALIDQAV